MRLIDADVLKQHIDKLPALPDGNFAGNHSALKALINMQPTIEPSTNCSEIPNNSDTISRQAAIDLFPNDALEWDTKGGYIAPHLARRMIEELPPVQPNHVAESGRMVERTAENAQNVQNEDLILRKAAIESIRECAEVAHDNREWGMEQGYLNAIECVEEEPSAQPEQKTDEWIPISKETNPTKSGWYLVTVHEDVTNDNERFTGMAEFNATNGMWYDIDEPTDMYLRWMPLPEPYGGGEKK